MDGFRTAMKKVTRLEVQTLALDTGTECIITLAIRGPQDDKYKRRIIIHLKPMECGKAQGGYYETHSVIYGCPDASKEWYKHYCTFMNDQAKNG
jgi:hypothetical protein